MASWGPEEIRQNASTWSLEGDAKLLQLMESIAKNLETRCTSTTTNINNMLLDLDDCNIAFGNTVNQFNALQHDQFVENRVYEDDDDETAYTNTTDCDNDDEDEKKPEIINASDAIKLTIENTINFMDQFCEKVPLKLDDSDSDNDETSNDSNGTEIENKNFIYKLKNPYQDRPMPYIIGSDEWREKWHVGLEDSDIDSEPEDKEQYSESSGDNISLTPSNDQTISGSEGGSIWGLRQPIMEIKPNEFHPSSDDDVDDNEEDNNDVSSTVSSVKNFQTSNTQQKRVQVLPIISNVAKPAAISTNIFSEEPPEDNYPIPAVRNVLKKSEKKHGLFDTDSDSDQNQFSDDHLDFKPNNNIQNKKQPNEYFTKQQGTNAERKTINLFDDEPPDAEFLPKKPVGGNLLTSSQPLASGKKIVNLFDDLDDDFEDLVTTKGKVEVIASDNRADNNKSTTKSFLDNDDGNLNKTSIAANTKRKEVKKSIFDDDEEDDLAATGAAALSVVPATIENIMEDDDFLFGNTAKTKKTNEQQTINKFKNLFADDEENDDDFDKIFKQDKKIIDTVVSEEKKNVVTGTVKKVLKQETPKVTSLFADLDDDDDDDIFGNKTAKLVQKVVKPLANSVDDKKIVKDDFDDIFASKKPENLFASKDVLISDTKVKIASNTNVISDLEGEDSDDLFGSKKKNISKTHIADHAEKLLPPTNESKNTVIIKPKIDVSPVMLEDDDDDFDSIFKKVDPASIKTRVADKISLKLESDTPIIINQPKPPVKKFISFLDDPPSDNEGVDDLFSAPKIIVKAKVEPDIAEESKANENPIKDERIAAEETEVVKNKEKTPEKSTLMFNLDFDEPPEDDFDELFTKKNTFDETEVPKSNATKTNLSSLFGNDQPPPFDENENMADDDDNTYPDDDENDKSININKNDFLNNMQSIFIDNEPPPDPEFDSQFISTLINNDKISSALKPTSRKSSLFNETDDIFDKDEKKSIAGPSSVIKTNRNIYYDDFADTFIPPASATATIFSNEPPSLINDDIFVEEPPSQPEKIKDVTDNLSINNNFKEKLNLFKQPPSISTAVSTSPIKIDDINNVKKRSVADLIQEATIKSSESPIVDNNLPQQKRLTKKLNKNNLNINVAALLPGAKMPSTKNNNNLSDNSPVENVAADANAEKEVSIISSPKYTSNDDDDIANNNDNPSKLSHLNKNRIKIQVKRRPSTRRGREENYRKSLLTVDNDLNENYLDDDDDSGVDSANLLSKQPPPPLLQQKVSTDSNKNKINELCIKDEKILALFAEEDKKMLEQKRLDLVKKKEEADEKEKEAKRRLSHEKSKVSIVKQLESKEIEKQKPKNIENSASGKKEKMSLFESSNDEDDLFSKKGTKNPALDSSSISTSSKTVAMEKVQKKNLFDDEDDDDDSLFGGSSAKKEPKKPADNPKDKVKKSSVDDKKNTNLFGESDDEDNFDDIFTPRTTTSTTGKTPSVQPSLSQQTLVTNKSIKKNIQKTKSTSSINDDPLADLLNG